MCLYEPPTSHILVGLAVLIGASSAVRGARCLARGLRHARSLDVIRGIRGLVIALAAAAFSLGVLTAETGFLVFGAVFLGEELYETGILVLILRFGEPRSRL